MLNEPKLIESLWEMVSWLDLRYFTLPWKMVVILQLSVLKQPVKEEMLDWCMNWEIATFVQFHDYLSIKLDSRLIKFYSLIGIRLPYLEGIYPNRLT